RPTMARLRGSRDPRAAYRVQNGATTVTELVVAIHWIHVLAGAFLFGSVMGVFWFAVPALLKQPPAQAHATFTTYRTRLTSAVPSGGNLTIWLGLLRGTWLGPVTSMNILLTTSYGHLFLAGILLTVAALIHGGTSANKIEEKVWDGDQFRPGGEAFVR